MKDKTEAICTAKTTLELIDEGVNLYYARNYEAALEKFKEAKRLDDGSYKYDCNYKIGLVHIKQAENAEDPTQKQLFYSQAADRFKKTARDDLEGEYNDINTDIAEALFNAGKLEEAKNFLNKSKALELMNKINQQMGDSSTELVLYNQDSNSPIAQAYYTSQDNKESPHYPLIQLIYELWLKQKQQEKEIKQIRQEITGIKNTLHIIGADTQENINNTAGTLQGKLYKYYCYFNSSLQNIYMASRVIGSNLVVGDAGHMERKNFLAAEKGGCYIADIMGCGFFCPSISAVINVCHDAIDNIFNTSAEKRLKEALKNFSTVINKQLSPDLSIEQNIQQLALFYAHIKEKEILNIQNENEQGGVIRFFTKKLLPTRQKLADCIEQDSDDPVIKLAFKDVTALISYIQDKAEEMIASSLPFVVQIAKVVEKELDTYYYNNIKNNQLNSIEYALEQIENNLLESAKINERIESGQLDNLQLPLISVNLWSLFTLDLFNIFRLSWTGEQRGVKSFSNKEYFRKNCNNQNITDKDLDNCMLLLFHKICKSGNEELIRYFKEENASIIEFARINAPQLFVTEEAIDICIANPQQNRDAKSELKLRSPQEFFENCFKKIFPNVDIEKLRKEEQPEPQPLLDNPDLEQPLIEFYSPRSDGEEDVEVAGNNLD